MEIDVLEEAVQIFKRPLRVPSLGDSQKRKTVATGMFVQIEIWRERCNHSDDLVLVWVKVKSLQPGEFEWDRLVVSVGRWAASLFSVSGSCGMTSLCLPKGKEYSTSAELVESRR